MAGECHGCASQDELHDMAGRGAAGGTKGKRMTRMGRESIHPLEIFGGWYVAPVHIGQLSAIRRWWHTWHLIQRGLSTRRDVNPRMPQSLFIVLGLTNMNS